MAANNGSNDPKPMRVVNVPDLEPSNGRGKSKNWKRHKRGGRPKGSGKGRAVAAILHDLGYEPISKIVERLCVYEEVMDHTTYIAANVQLARFLYPQMANKQWEPSEVADDLIIQIGGSDIASEGQRERWIAEGRKLEREAMEGGEVIAPGES
ncbi:MAG: hypothetical protein ACR2OR_08775 [Hyphomicrobiales bacterium]